jgi:hypothetical protein
VWHRAASENMTRQKTTPLLQLNPMALDNLEPLSKISESTVIPISLLITFLGGVAWLTTMAYKTDATAQEVIAIKERQEVYIDRMNEVISRLIRIESKLEYEKR